MARRKRTTTQRRERIYELVVKYANNRVSDPDWKALWNAILDELYK